MGSGNSTEVGEQIQQAVCTDFRPPLSFYLWVHRSIRREEYSLGPEKAQANYYISTSHNITGGDGIVLHNGPSADAAVLAALDSYGSTENIILPPLERGLPGYRSEFAGSRQTANAFVFQVPVGKEKQVASFEWRRSSSAEAGGLGVGWKLVSANSGNGGEILAVWSKSSFSWSKGAEFRFTNSGATGQLGNAFALSAVLSFAKMYQRMVQESRGQSAASVA